MQEGMFIDYRRADLLKSKEYVNYYSAEKNIQLNNLLYESSLFDGVFSLIFNCTCWLYDSFLYWIL